MCDRISRVNAYLEPSALGTPGGHHVSACVVGNTVQYCTQLKVGLQFVCTPMQYTPYAVTSCSAAPEQAYRGGAPNCLYQSFFVDEFI